MKKKILLIDDDLIYQQIIRRLLCTAYNLNVIGEFKDAINYLNENENPDLVIADLNLPGAVGLDLILSIQDKLNSDRTKILVISGMDDDDLNKHLYDLGVYEILTKPVDRKMLKEKIDKLIG